ncbi:hypothetical protein IE53DRAFT_90967 [Violaceomyces palustris]|uniref:Uncharacterized protein n=1 Tax=Violaceomyces palustris TaxID=1673888 RepID=A0ACD0NXK3_9BASI|nr:hypothetical protein IE53DRAFT_90967 [Violaceomyces palustris]
MVWEGRKRLTLHYAAASFLNDLMAKKCDGQAPLDREAFRPVPLLKRDRVLSSEDPQTQVWLATQEGKKKTSSPSVIPWRSGVSGNEKGRGGRKADLDFVGDIYSNDREFGCVQLLSEQPRSKGREKKNFNKRNGKITSSKSQNVVQLARSGFFGVVRNVARGLPGTVDQDRSCISPTHGRGLNAAENERFVGQDRSTRRNKTLLLRLGNRNAQGNLHFSLCEDGRPISSFLF